jgi:hypothetical protein
MLAAHPGLSLGEVRQLLRSTATREPAECDANGPGLETTHFNEWDHSGQNFKLGHGRLDALGACLAAADPVCYALLATGGPLAPSSPSIPSEREAARGWELSLRRLGARHSLARCYLALRGHLVSLLLSAPSLQDALFWLARHLRALRLHGSPDTPGEAGEPWALLDRCMHVFEVLLGLLGQLPARAAAAELTQWCQDMMRLLETLPPRAVARFLIGTLTPPLDAGAGT